MRDEAEVLRFSGRCVHIVERACTPYLKTVEVMGWTRSAQVCANTLGGIERMTQITGRTTWV